MFDHKMRFLTVSLRYLANNEFGEAAKVIGRSLYEIFPDIPPRWCQELASEETFSRAKTAARSGYGGQ
jgi:hypothetical protein